MSREAQITERLTAAFQPTELVVTDESESHRGHAGFQDGGESHFHVRIRSATFGPMNRLARHRAVHGAIGPQLMAEIHALALDVSA
ncbi:BolA family transcriptional regulator [Actibacterium sp. 188UL27-1]|uniref:BolA family protein n=1 Tax=Actibacterium sp. 188UL27-1 TaxID=2786961 RepID=UPI00195B021E|nr:BolA family protein [Actibacterium sp. 188UL27-1]MBM7069313.1 BolA family transcriptional regulator [Actibacterium sp. 188UL27-1]